MTSPLPQTPFKNTCHPVTSLHLKNPPTAFQIKKTGELQLSPPEKSTLTISDWVFHCPDVRPVNETRLLVMIPLEAMLNNLIVSCCIN